MEKKWKAVLTAWVSRNPELLHWAIFKYWTTTKFCLQQSHRSYAEIVTGSDVARDNLQPFMFFARGEEVIFSFRSLWLITEAESLNNLCQLVSHHMYWPMDCVPLFGDLDRRKNSGFYKNPIPKLMMSGKGNSQPQRDWDGWQIACNLRSGDFFFRLIAD